jgi:hypothetical protein
VTADLQLQARPAGAGRYGIPLSELPTWSHADRQRTTTIAKHISQVVTGFIDKNPTSVDTMTGLMILERQFRDLAMLDSPPGVTLTRYWELQDRLIDNASAGSHAYGRREHAKGRHIYLAVRRDTKTLLSILNRALGTNYAI